MYKLSPKDAQLAAKTAHLINVEECDYYYAELSKYAGPQSAASKESLLYQAGAMAGIAAASRIYNEAIGRLYDLTAGSTVQAMKALELADESTSQPLLDALLEWRNMHVVESNMVWSAIRKHMTEAVAQASGVGPKTLAGETEFNVSEFVDIVNKLYDLHDYHLFMSWYLVREEEPKLFPLAMQPRRAGYRRVKVTEELAAQYLDWASVQYQEAMSMLDTSREEHPFPNADTQRAILTFMGQEVDRG